jgi:UDP-N-acetylmuramoyl-tripeptide--D-alanyl-D-alanine ligase
MWQYSEIIEATGGTAQGFFSEAKSVTIDSRHLQPSALFVALKGERVDGHDYVKAAFNNGAIAALVERLPEGMGENAPLIIVGDTYKALLALAEFSRKRTQALIIAITGSVGKTGTKEAVQIALSTTGKVYATQGNFNNHIGLPLSLANLPRDAKFGVFEMGMNHAGEIAFLSRMAKPDIAVITNVESVHLEFFSGIEDIAKAKAEIMEGLSPNGTLILNGDSAVYNQLYAIAKAHNVQNILTFGEVETADFRLTDYVLQSLGSQIEAVISDTAITYRLGTLGRHWAIISLAALAAATSAGADLANAAAALAHFSEPEGRGKLQRIPLKQGNFILIDDCYNASPASMKAAIIKLSELYASFGNKGRKIAVLGDMLELGVSAEKLHKDLLVLLQHYKIDKIYAAGPLMKYLYEILPPSMQGDYANNATLLTPMVQQALYPNDIVLIKGSHGSRMDIVRTKLMASAGSYEQEDAHAI